MSQADVYVRIVTQNDVSEAQRSTEQLGDTIQEALDTTPADNMTNAMGSLEDGISDTGDAALKTGDIIKANLVSEAVTQGIQKLGSALKAAASNAVSMAMSNETAFAKASTLLSGDDLTKYFEGLIEMSNRTGVAFTDLAESMYSALSAGVPQDNVLEFVENTVNLSKGGFTQTATAIDIVTTALNAYQMEMSEATHVQDVLITTQNLGKTTVDELASNMGKLIPTANSVNVAFDQLGAMYATVTANGVATAETTTYLNAMINELGASGSTAEKAMQAATAGTDMAVLLKMNMRDGFRGGMEIDETMQVAKRLEQSGAHALVLSGGFVSKAPMYVMRGQMPIRSMTHYMNCWWLKYGVRMVGKWMIPTVPFKEAYFLEDALKFRAEIKMPLVYVGGLVSREKIDEVLNDGFDAVQMARALLNEPGFVNRMREEEKALCNCKHSNYCIARMYSIEMACHQHLNEELPAGLKREITKIEAKG